MILCIETATRTCSVALTDDKQILSVAEDLESQSHAEKLTLFIDEVMKKSGFLLSDIDAVSVSKGPGSYTGLRIGVSTAKGLCYALDKPLIAVDTLLAYAQGFIAQNPQYADGQTLLFPMIDARRMEVYTEIFDQDLHCVKPTHTLIVDEHSFDEFQQHVVVFGDGADKLETLFANSDKVTVVKGFHLSASYQAELAQKALNTRDFVDTAYFEPFYLKDFVPGVPTVKGL